LEYRQVFVVNDMASDKERQRVIEAVASLDGVASCELAPGSVRKIVVVYDRDRVTEQDIVARIAEVGYEVA